MAKADTIIVGAGSAGLSALRQAQKQGNRCLLIEQGSPGTTCARTGCMPSKALLHVANQFYSRHGLAAQGVSGTEHLRADLPAVLRHVRKQRDRFVEGMQHVTRKRAGEGFLSGTARLAGPHEVVVDGQRIEADRIILAVGARPVVPGPWRALGNRVLTRINVFEQEDLPPRIATIGLGAIGLELGQALSRLGIEITGFTASKTVAGLTDEQVNAQALSIFGEEFPLYPGHPAEVQSKGTALEIRAGSIRVEADAILVAMGVKPDFDQLGLETLGIPLDENGQPPWNPRTGQVADLPVYIAGDATGCNQVLHEALDEGFIAGRNAAGAGKPEPFCRRTPLRLVFSDPPCAVVGLSHAALRDRDIVTGEVNFKHQSRAQLEGRNRGTLRLYVERNSSRLLGAEGCAPDAEHLFHLLALAIQEEKTVYDLLRMPFYHPTTEEGLRSALRNAAAQLSSSAPSGELSLCESAPEEPLS